MARLGIFGGTFDPPHIGHRILAAEAYYQLELDRLLWVLTPHPPHKPITQITPLHHRSDMLTATIADDPCFEFCDVDINRPGPHYAFETVQILREQQPKAELIYLMGADSLRDLHTWRNPHELVEEVSALGVMVRPGVELNSVDIEFKIPGLSAKLKFINAPLIDISASEIRHRIAHGLPFRYLVPTPVYRIIQERSLYRIRQ
jgi:nicotinate-nucleotide adenylyltransferase